MNHTNNTPKPLDPGAGALLWAQTYMAVHTSKEQAVKQKFLATSQRYMQYAKPGPLLTAALKRGHVEVARNGR